MEAIRRFPFDTVLMALNAADPHHLSFAQELLPLAVEKEMGIIGMKIPARGRILSTLDATASRAAALGAGGRHARARSRMREAMHYVLSLPVSTVIVGCDTIAQVEENVQLARAFTPISETQMAELADRTEPIKRQALFFRRWEA